MMPFLVAGVVGTPRPGKVAGQVVQVVGGVVMLAAQDTMSAGFADGMKVVELGVRVGAEAGVGLLAAGAAVAGTVAGTGAGLHLRPGEGSYHIRMRLLGYGGEDGLGVDAGRPTKGNRTGAVDQASQTAGESFPNCTPVPMRLPGYGCAGGGSTSWGRRWTRQRA